MEEHGFVLTPRSRYYALSDPLEPKARVINSIGKNFYWFDLKNYLGDVFIIIGELLYGLIAT